MKQSESMVKSADLLNIQRPLQTDEQAQGDLLYNHKEKTKSFEWRAIDHIVYRRRICQNSCPREDSMTKDAE